MQTSHPDPPELKRFGSRKHEKGYLIPCIRDSFIKGLKRSPQMNGIESVATAD